MRHSQKGVTLLELLTVVSITGILLSFAIPSVQTMVERGDLNEVMQRLRTDINLARSEAVRRDQTIYLSFQTGAASCWGMSEGAQCNCSVANACQVRATDTVWRTVQASLANMGNVTFDAGNTSIGLNGGVINLQFSPTGTVTNNGFIEIDTPGMNGRVQVNAIGRAKLCSSSISGLPATATCN